MRYASGQRYSGDGSDGMGKRRKIVKITATILGIIVSLCAVLFILAEILYRTEHGDEIWRPDYEKIDILPLLQKEERTDEDYAVLYAQTGLTRLGVDGLLEKGNINRILRIQTDYFADYAIEYGEMGPYTCLEAIDSVVAHCALEEGDIVVSAMTHVVSWRLGHAMLVLNPNGQCLEAFTVGTVSELSDISSFTSTSSFMILRPKVPKETREAVAAFAKENLLGIRYSVFTGIFTKKNSARYTQCAHVVWYAYKQFGIDLDSTGGPIVTPKDVANSSKVEVVQIYGFNPEKLWR